MKKSTIYWFCRFLLILVVLFTNGCWSYHELNQLAVVAGTAIDRGRKPGTVQLTLQIFKPSAAQSGGGGGGVGGGGGQQQPFIVKSRAGKTIFDAAQNFLAETDRRLYWPHNQVIILGNEQARHGVRLVLDYFIRTNEPRPTIWILVAEKKAGAILYAPGELEKVSAMEISQLVQAQAASSKNVMINLQDFVSRLLSKTVAPIATLIKINEVGGKKRLILSGTAVFKGDRLIGILDGRQTRGLLWVQGKVKQGAVIINVPGGKAGLEIARSRTKVKPVLLKNKFKIKVSIHEEGNLDCQMSPEELTKPDQLKSLARREATVIKNEINAALTKAKEFNADIFGFSEAIHKSNPKEWRKIKDKWDQIFPELQVDVDVNCVIHGVGLTIPPLAPPPE
jgi:spore germination protein KC